MDEVSQMLTSFLHAPVTFLPNHNCLRTITTVHTIWRETFLSLFLIICRMENTFIVIKVVMTAFGLRYVIHLIQVIRESILARIN